MTTGVCVGVGGGGGGGGWELQSIVGGMDRYMYAYVVS